MTVVRPNSIAGINSITVQTGQALNIHDASGNLIRNITSSSGVSTFSSLHVGAGTTTSTQGISVGTGCSIISETVNNLDVYTNSSKRIRIQNDGRVGVNTENAIFNNTSQIATASLYHSDPKIGVQGSIVIGNISPTISDNRELAFYRRGGTNPGTAMSTHSMGRVAWYGGSNDTTLPDRVYTIECIPNGGGWTNGANRRAAITFNNHEAEVLRIASDGKVGIGTSSAASQLEVNGATSADVATFNSHNANGVLINLQRSGTNTGFLGSGKNIADATGGADDIGLRSQANLIFTSGGDSERVRVRTDGRVSIASSLAVTGVTTAAAFIPSEGQLSHRRVNINGAMQVWQRSTSASDIGGSNGYFAADRYRSSNNGSGRHTISRDTDTPTGEGFGHSMKIDVTTAVASPSANNYTFIQHRIEGQDVAQFAKGTASAKQYALSFWVKSPKTGVHVIQWEDVENSRSVQGTYTIASANTWEKHSIIFPADTSGGITCDNAHRMQLYFWLFAGSTYNNGNVNSLGTTWASTGSISRASGQVNVFDNTSNNFYITGIQLELGSVVTPFEHRSWQDELDMCHRYYQVYRNGTNKSLGLGFGYGTGEVDMPVNFIKQMRTDATLVHTYGSSYYQLQGGVSSGVTVDGAWTFQLAGEQGGNMYSTNLSGSISLGSGYHVRQTNSSAYVHFNAEL